MKLDRIKLRTELLKRNLKQKNLTELSGLSRMTVSAICCGKTCSDESGKKIAAVLGVDVKELLEE